MSGPIHTRQPEPIHTRDSEAIPKDYAALGLLQLTEQLHNLARLVENKAKLVDEYNTSTLVGPGTTNSLQVLPNFEYAPELIESIIVTGPAGLVTLQIGDRVWPVTIPAAGFVVIAPIAILLSRMDNRILTAATPGAYTFELMGKADKRFAT